MKERTGVILNRTGLLTSVAPTRSVDGLRFHDQSRFRSSEVTRAFVSAIRAVSQGAQSEVSQPDAVALEPGDEADS